ncbi:MAG: hypothetical protein FJZ87_05970 [Chloroflexi bacterium]|nr:hypothetical protein [Chloroflexota bacterium]
MSEMKVSPLPSHPIVRSLFLRFAPPLGTSQGMLAGFLAAASALFANAAAAPTLPEYGYDAARLASERARTSRTAAQRAARKRKAAALLKGDGHPRDDRHLC